REVQRHADLAGPGPVRRGGLDAREAGLARRAVLARVHAGRALGVLDGAEQVQDLAGRVGHGALLWSWQAHQAPDAAGATGPGPVSPWCSEFARVALGQFDGTLDVGVEPVQVLDVDIGR